MDRFWHNYTSIVASVMPVCKDRHESCCRETDDKKTKNEEISFGEVLNEAMKNRK